MQGHTMTEIVNHSRSTAWEPVSKILYIIGRWGAGGGEGREGERGLNRHFTWPFYGKSLNIFYV